MTKCLATIALYLILSFVCSSEEISFSLVPKEFFVGDEVRAQYSFISNDAFLESLTEKGQYTFFAKNLFSSAGFDCDCTSMQVSKLSSPLQHNSYTVTIVFYAYSTGIIDLPPFDLAELILMSLEMEQKPASYSSIHMDLPPFEVLSILSRYPSDSLRPPKGPVIIPGTTYVLYVFAVLLVIVIAFGVYIVLKFEKIQKKILAWYHMLFMSVNLKQSLYALKRLQKKVDEILPSEFAQTITIILRSFLEKRFYLPFSCACTNELHLLFNERFKDTYTDEQYDAIQNLYTLFLRCDFIRFSFSQTSSQILSSEERKKMLQEAHNLLVFFEKGEAEYA